MPINNSTAILRAKSSIEDLRTVFSLSNCERLHADVTGYCRALHESDVINENEWNQLLKEADAALAERKQFRGPIFPGWMPLGDEK